MSSDHAVQVGSAGTEEKGRRGVSEEAE